MSNEILLYQSSELTERIEVRLENETVWLNRQQLAMLFGRDIKTIGKHINNVFNEGELVKELVVAKFATTTPHGAIKGKTQTQQVEYYNLDVIISVGYRVKSIQGTKFRIWATNVLRDYLLKGYVLNQRVNRIENTVEKLSEKVDEISFQIKSSELPTQGVFFDGQIFDAYELASKIIRSAKANIVLIDNYIDETTLTHLTKKSKDVKVLLLTKNISKQLQLDVQKANAQYGNFEIKNFTLSHDRFIIIDNVEVYHLGASLKDLGKKWFAFTKMDRLSVEGILNAIANFPKSKIQNLK
ncbi:MAG: virulence RhuM family protein [Bacteroidales bacterium]|jgi:hypothetical protein|nr:virulence RhuM family protein [Bacteroidales bacterium]